MTKDKIFALMLDGKNVAMIHLPAPKKGDTALKDEIHSIIGGQGIAVAISSDAMLVANEQLDASGMMQNPIASLLARRQIFGNALIIGISGDIDYDTGSCVVADVPDDIVKALMGDG